MILGVDNLGNVLLVVSGTDHSTMPTEFNGATLIAVVLTDAQEATYLALPANRGGTTFFKGVLAALAVPPNTAPDPTGFTTALKSALGSQVANGLMKVYPLFFPAVTERVWADVQWCITDALASGAITTAQYTEFQVAATAFKIPVVLP
jgi:hypothetical protein